MSPVNTNTLNRIRYGIYAPFYDGLARPLASGRAQAFRLLRVKPGERVLIIGSGTGLDLAYLSAENDITAVDLTPGMIRKSSERARKLGLKADCKVMNAHHLDLPDEAFDVVILHLVLAVLPDPEACIREACRVLKTSGRMSILDKFLPDNASASPFRKLVGAATNVLFSNINRQLGPLLAIGRLLTVESAKASFGGFYTVNIVQKMQWTGGRYRHWTSA